MARTPKSPTPVAEAAKKPEVPPAAAAVTPPVAVPVAEGPAKTFEIMGGNGEVIGLASSQAEADELIADHRAAGRCALYAREVEFKEPEADAEAAGA